MKPYAKELEDLQPFSEFTQPYYQHYVDLVEYNGAARDIPVVKAADVSQVRIGFIGPLEARLGPSPDKLVRSVSMPTSTLSEPGTSLWSGFSSDVAWGKASDELVGAVYDHNVIATIAFDRASSHLAEQIGVKAFVRVIAISSDRVLTSINIPWIFRLPEGTSLDQALQIVTAAEQQSGPNRSKLREVLSSGSQIAGVRFQSTREPRQPRVGSRRLRLSGKFAAFLNFAHLLPARSV